MMSTAIPPVGPNGDSADENTRPPAPVTQALAIVLGNILLSGLVWLLLQFGYREHGHATPLLFLFCEIGAIVGVIVLSFPEYVLSVFVAIFNITRLLWNGVRSDQRPLLPPPKLTRWKQRLRKEDVDTLSRDFFGSSKFIVYAAATVNFIALGDLVYETGGGILSPFAPLLLAPAVLGLIIVQKREGVVLLLIAAVFMALGTDLLASQHKSERTGVLGKPHWEIYGAVALILVACAALVRWVSLPSTAASPNVRRVGLWFVRVTRRDAVLPPNDEVAGSRGVDGANAG